MKLKRSTKILIIICVAGLSLLLYPTVSNYWNSKHSTYAINNYVETIDEVSAAKRQQMWQDANEYNRSLLDRISPYALPDETEFPYDSTLNVDGNGVMGYIEIDKLDVSLPLYHGTSERVLQHAIGHLEWSSLPVGGESTHCVVSGHRGLPSARLFTDLDKLREGDTFTLFVLDEVLTYEVDQIRIVLPDETEDLLIEEGKDYCTLVTCTPYGVNTHRLLVRGHRIETAYNDLRIVSEAVVIDPLIVAPIVAFPLLFTLLMMVMLKKPEKKPKLHTNI